MIFLSYIGISIGAIAGAFVLYLAVVAVIPGFSVPEQPVAKTGHPALEEGPRNSATNPGSAESDSGKR